MSRKTFRFAMALAIGYLLSLTALTSPCLAADNAASASAAAQRQKDLKASPVITPKAITPKTGTCKVITPKAKAKQITPKTVTPKEITPKVTAKEITPKQITPKVTPKEITPKAEETPTFHFDGVKPRIIPFSFLHPRGGHCIEHD